MNLGNHLQLCIFAIIVYFNLKKHILWTRQSVSSEASAFLFGRNTSFYETRLKITRFIRNCVLPQTDLQESVRYLRSS